MYILTTSKCLTGTPKFGFFLQFEMIEDDNMRPAHSMSIRGWSTDCSCTRFKSRTPQNRTWRHGNKVYKQHTTLSLSYINIHINTHKYTLVSQTHTLGGGKQQGNVQINILHHDLTLYMWHLTFRMPMLISF